MVPKPTLGTVILSGILAVSAIGCHATKATTVEGWPGWTPYEPGLNLRIDLKYEKPLPQTCDKCHVEAKHGTFTKVFFTKPQAGTTKDSCLSPSYVRDGYRNGQMYFVRNAKGEYIALAHQNTDQNK
jgi:hypothetical protein